MQLRAVGQVAIDRVHPGVAHALAARRRLEGLQLHQELVHHAGDALTAAVSLPTTRPADGIDLLDEPDGATLGAGVLAQTLEEGADFAVRLAEIHRLERRGGDEQERHLGLFGHGLGHEGLAGSRRSFEEHAAASGATHGVAKGLMGEEEVHRSDDLSLDPVDPDHVLEADLGLTGADQTGGGNGRPRASGPSMTAAEEQDDDDGGEPAIGPGRDRDGGEHPVPRDQPVDEPGQDDHADDEHATEALLVAAPLGLRHIGVDQDRVTHRTDHGMGLRQRGSGVGTGRFGALPDDVTGLEPLVLRH